MQTSSASASENGPSRSIRLHAGFFADGVDADEVGVVNARGGLCFPLETPDVFLVGNKVERKDLDGDVNVEAGVAAEVDRPHTSATQLLYNRDGPGLWQAPLVARQR